MGSKGKRILKIGKLKKGIIIPIAILIILVFVIMAFSIFRTNQEIGDIEAEIARSMTYNQVQEGENITEDLEGRQVENVKFDAFFLRDLDGDGYTESLRGTCREIGSQDTLYMELNVLTEGELRDAKIEIQGNNFYLATSLPKDQQLKTNYIGSNIKTLEFNTMRNGTQKMIMGTVRSGDYTFSSGKNTAIGNNINNYSREDNKVILTGKYIKENGEEIQIKKEVPLTVDWYGTTNAEIYVNSSLNKYEDIDNRVNEEAGIITLDAKIRIDETTNKLLLSKNYLEGVIPELNGYAPISVSTTSTGIEFTYSEETRKFTITKTAELDANGNITKNAYKSDSSQGKNNTYELKIEYPLEAYKNLGEDTITIKIPVEGYYEGYNNQNEEFQNPYKSNIAKGIIVANYSKPQGKVARVEVTVGKYVSNPTYRYIVSKEKPLKIYNEIAEEQKDDLYTVRWYASTGTDGNTSGLILKETKNGEQQAVDRFIKADGTEDSMENVTTNIGIYFSGADSLLKEDGFIKVYDDETDIVLATFTKDNWNKYTASSPYKYEIPVKHIRIETSETKAESSIAVYNIKELDDKYITDNYTREEFDNLKYIKSNLVGYLQGTYINSDTHQANYEAPFSVATISLSQSTLSTQLTEKNEQIIITAEANIESNKVGWINGSFLIKVPSEILTIDINNITINNNQVEITSYEVIEKEGTKFIKINTQNKTDAEQSYKITIDCDITPDPRITTVNRAIELYASNEVGSDYYYKDLDTYDVNNNLNTTEQINKTTTSISLVSPNSLLTNEVISNFDDNGTIVVAPQIADITPKYGVVANDENEATIEVQAKNNYSSSISEVLILGKIPFEGNTYVFQGGDLNSSFTTTMKETGIKVPDELEGKVTVYYSENENPTKNLLEASNGWKKAEEVTDWSKIKTYAIDFEDTIIEPQKEYVFYYTVKVPNGVDFNKVAYSHHGIYFSLHTDEGKYRTQTEPNKVGIRIAEKYNLELTKYQTGKTKKVQGATYSISEIEINGQEVTVVGTKTGTTNAQGVLTINNLYAERIYEIKEIKSPTDYEQNSDTIRFITHVNRETGALTVEKLLGTTKGNMQVTKPENEDYKVQVEVEDEAKARLKITKYEQGTETKLSKVVYKITGEKYNKRPTTNENGEINVNGLKIGVEYTLEEIKAEGYYLASPITFKIVNNNGTYEVQVKNNNNEFVAANESGNELIKAVTTTEEDSLPIANISLEDEKIPTYDLELIKIKRVTTVTAENQEQQGENEQETTYLSGAKFRLYKGTETIGDYITDENGKLTIPNLYQYESDHNIDQTYRLKELIAPEGYAGVKDIVFKVEEVTEQIEVQEGLDPIQVTKLQFIEELEDAQTAKAYTVEGNKVSITVEDSPSFKLTKKDGETEELLPNTKFAIYNVDMGETPATDEKGEIVGTKETIDGKEYYVVTTDSNGEIAANLKEGLYKAVEVQASDEKYDITGQTYYFGIGTSREPQTIMTAEWAKSVEGSDNQITSIVETSDGGMLVGGYFNGTIQVGEYTLTSSGSNDGMIIKYGSNGEVEWAERVGGTSADEITSIVATSDGGIAVVGYFSGSTQVGEYTLTSSGSNDGMIIKYGSNGEVEWAERVGGSGNFADRLTSIAETNEGDYVVGGYISSRGDIQGNIQVGSYMFPKGDDTRRGIIVRYSNRGDVEWASMIYGNFVEIPSIAETSNGEIIVCGSFRSCTITLGSYSLSAGGNEYAGMIIKYNNQGEIMWATQIGGSKDERVKGIVTTDDGGLIASGYFSARSIRVGEYTLTNANTNNYYSDGMIIKYSSSGEVEWAERVGGTGNDYITSIVETSDGGCAVGGYFSSSSIQVGEYTLTSASSDGMIIKYGSNGEVDWAERVGGSNRDYITSIIETRDGSYAVGGYFYGNGYGKLVNVTSSTNGMIIKFEPKEIPTIYTNWAERVGGTGQDYITSIVETNDGGYAVGGYFESSSIQVGDYTLTRTGSSYDGMILKYTNSGEVEWAERVVGTSGDYITSIVATSDGGIAVVGYFYGSTQVGEYTLTSAGSNDGMIIKYSSSGEVEWAECVGGTGNEYINSIVETQDGGIAVGGYFESSSIQVGDYTLTSAGSDDGMIIKYDVAGEVEWAERVGGEFSDQITSIVATSDGGYAVGGYFNSRSIQVGEYTLTRTGSSYDGMILKYTNSGEVDWAECVGGTGKEYINSIVETQDGGIAVGGRFDSYTLQVGNSILRNSYSTGYDGMIIKYDSSGKVEWVDSTGGEANGNPDEIKSVIATSDGGIAVGGNFSNDIGVGDYALISAGLEDGLIIKYDAEGKVDWAERVGGSYRDYITSIVETRDGGMLVGGHFTSDSIQVGEYTLTNANASSQDGMIFKITPLYGASEQSEVEVRNRRKEYKITTDVEEIDGVKGGAISGEDKKPYETVKHGDNSIKEIKMTPDENYEIIGITVNGEEYQYTVEQDGTFTMPQFENVTEDKHVVVKYAMKDNKIIINKVDSKTGEKLPGATFKLQQIEEREEPEGVIGSLTDNSGDFAKVEVTDTEITGVLGNLTDNGAGVAKVEGSTEITGVLGNLTDNGTPVNGVSYNFVEQDGKYVPQNSKTYQSANGGSAGIGNTTANSYLELNLNGRTGKYFVVVNARVSSQASYDYGYATISQTTTAPLYNTTSGVNRFLSVAGNTTSTNVDKDYISNVLEGDSTYYIHLGYRKNGSTDTGEDQIVINSIKVYEANTYNFVEQDGKYVPQNSATWQLANGGTAGVGNTTANSYVKLDLSGKTGKYFVAVNARVSSQASYDYGYATISQTTTAPSYSTTSGVNRFLYVAGNTTSTNVDKDYTSNVLDGGGIYYIHLGYYKNASTDTGEDQIVINSIKVYEAKQYNFVEQDGKYVPQNSKTWRVANVEGTTAGMGDTTANSYIPIDLTGKTGTYVLTVNAQVSSQSGDYGYATVTEETTAPAYNSTSGRFIYISGTTGTNTEANNYTTVLEGEKIHYLHLGYYKNVDTDGGEDKFTVNSIKVTLNDGDLYHTEVTTNSDGQAITQIPFGKYLVTETKAPEGYYINDSIPDIEFRSDNGTAHEFTVENEKKSNIIVHHYLKDKNGTYTESKVAEDEKQEGRVGERYTTSPKIDLEKYELEKNTEGEYVIPNNSTGDFTEEEQEVIYYYEAKQIPLTVHHYIEGTNLSVPLANGELAEDEHYSEEEHEEYTTNAKTEEELNPKYELVETPENATGTYEYDEVVVTYYYKEKEVKTTTKVEPYQETDIVTGETKEVKGGTITGEGKTPYETVKYGGNSQKPIKAVPDEGYYVKKITVNNVEIEFTANADGTVDVEQFIEMTEDKEVVVKFERIQTKVIVHHYIIQEDGTKTTIKVPSEVEGEVVEDEIKGGAIGSRYATKEAENRAEEYVFIETEGETSGTMTEEEKEVIYYYKYEPIEAKVIVHHYIEGTTTKLADDETKNGYVKDDYTTSKSSSVPQNYEVVSETPDKYKGKMTKEDIEVIYYYRLIEETVTNIIEKTGAVDSELANAGEGTSQVLTKEDGIVTYNMKYTSTIKDYIGKAKVTVVDTLPAKINTAKSNLAEGVYNEQEKTITWEEVITGINTFEDGDKEIIVEKEIKLVYEGQDVTKKLINTVKGTTVTYYPENDPAHPGEEKTTVEKETTATIEQEYKVDLPVEKVWEDSNNEKEKRPERIKLQLLANDSDKLNGTKLASAELSTANADNVDKNLWKYTFEGLEKYDNNGELITYSVEEIEITDGDLRYYKLPVISNRNNKTIVTNELRQFNTLVEESKIEKDGTKKITEKNEQVNYTINYSATVKDYVGNAKLTIVDTLPYHIDEANSELDGGIYSREAKTITWTEQIDNINTDVEGDKEISVSKEINVVYTDIDLTKNKMTNEVKATLKLLDLETPDEVEDRHDTEIGIKGKVIVKYIDKDTNKEITYKTAGDDTEKTYGYEFEEKVGKNYETEKKEIEKYEYVEDTGNTEGKVKEGQIEVIYYYTKIVEPDKKGNIVIKYVDEEEKELIPRDTEEGKVGDGYKTTPKEIEDYEYVKVTGEEEGTFIEGTITIIYHYKKKIDPPQEEKEPAKVIVKYLEKGTNKVLAKEEIIEGKVEDKYNTERKTIENYKKADPEPKNATGEMTKETIEVIYYYERMQGKIIVKYVDIDTEKDIVYKDEEGKEKTYNYEEKDNVGKEYKTKEKEIDYYEFVKVTENKEGKFKKEDQTIIYYYRKLPFNIGIEKTIKELIVNGEKKKIGTNSKLTKLEIPSKELSSTEVIVEYKVLVKNTAKIDGIAEIVDNIPEGFELASTNPTYWTKTKDGKIQTKVHLKVGEQKELLIALKWKSSSENIGTINNISEIINAENEANYLENNLADNISGAELIITIKTGIQRKNILIVAAIILVLSLITLQMKDLMPKKKKRKH